MNRLTLLVASLSAILLVACGGGFDVGTLEDDDIDQYADDALEGVQPEDAVAFFASGGKHYDIDAQTADREVLLPLCQRLQQDLQLKPVVVPYDDEESMSKWADEVFIALPADKALHESIRAEIRAADEKFNGSIQTDWGKKWLVFSLAPPGESD